MKYIFLVIPIMITATVLTVCGWKEDSAFIYATVLAILIQVSE